MVILRLGFSFYLGSLLANGLLRLLLQELLERYRHQVNFLYSQVFLHHCTNFRAVIVFFPSAENRFFVKGSVVACLKGEAQYVVVKKCVIFVIDMQLETLSAS